MPINIYRSTTWVSQCKHMEIKLPEGDHPDLILKVKRCTGCSDSLIWNRDLRFASDRYYR